GRRADGADPDLRDLLLALGKLLRRQLDRLRRRIFDLARRGRRDRDARRRVAVAAALQQHRPRFVDALVVDDDRPAVLVAELDEDARQLVVARRVVLVIADADLAGDL